MMNKKQSILLKRKYMQRCRCKRQMLNWRVLEKNYWDYAIVLLYIINGSLVFKTLLFISYY